MESEGTVRFAQTVERQGRFELSGSFAKPLKLHINFQFQMRLNIASFGHLGRVAQIARSISFLILLCLKITGESVVPSVMLYSFIR